MRKIVLNIPHSSSKDLDYPTPWTGGDIAKAKKELVDWHTEKLFVPGDAQPWVDKVIFPYCRFDCDAERLWSDSMEKIGQGIVYEKYILSGDGTVLNRKVDDRLRSVAMIEYSRHKLRLMDAITPGCLLIDCHSFPSYMAEDIDICIGYNDDWSKPDDGTLKMIINHFQNAGYRVGVNNPYSNSLAPDCGIQYHSVMIELNKRIYMDENTLEMTEDAIKIRSVLTNLYDIIGS